MTSLIPKSIASRLSRNNLCNAYKKCGAGASSVPPMKLTKSKTHTYLIDRNSPITAREYEAVLGKGIAVERGDAFHFS